MDEPTLITLHNQLNKIEAIQVEAIEKTHAFNEDVAFEHFKALQIDFNVVLENTTKLYEQLNTTLAGDLHFSNALENFAGQAHNRTEALTKLLNVITIDQQAVDRLLLSLEQTLSDFDAHVLTYLDSRTKELKFLFDQTTNQIENFMHVEQDLFDQVAKNLHTRGLGSSIDQLNRLEAIQQLIGQLPDKKLIEKMLKQQIHTNQLVKPLLEVISIWLQKHHIKWMSVIPWLVLALMLSACLLLTVIAYNTH